MPSTTTNAATPSSTSKVRREQSSSHGTDRGARGGDLIGRRDVLSSTGNPNHDQSAAPWTMAEWFVTEQSMQTLYVFDGGQKPDTETSSDGTKSIVGTRSNVERKRYCLNCYEFDDILIQCRQNHPQNYDEIMDVINESRSWIRTLSKDRFQEDISHAVWIYRFSKCANVVLRSTNSPGNPNNRERGDIAEAVALELNKRSKEQASCPSAPYNKKSVLQHISIGEAWDDFMKPFGRHLWAVSIAETPGLAELLRSISENPEAWIVHNEKTVSFIKCIFPHGKTPGEIPEMITGLSLSGLDSAFLFLDEKGGAIRYYSMVDPHLLDFVDSFKRKEEVPLPTTGNMMKYLVRLLCTAEVICALFPHGTSIDAQKVFVYMGNNILHPETDAGVHRTFNETVVMSFLDVAVQPTVAEKYQAEVDHLGNDLAISRRGQLVFKELVTFHEALGKPVGPNAPLGHLDDSFVKSYEYGAPLGHPDYSFVQTHEYGYYTFRVPYDQFWSLLYSAQRVLQIHHRDALTLGQLLQEYQLVGRDMDLSTHSLIRDGLCIPQAGLAISKYVREAHNASLQVAILRRPSDGKVQRGMAKLCPSQRGHATTKKHKMCFDCLDGEDAPHFKPIFAGDKTLRQGQALEIMAFVKYHNAERAATWQTVAKAMLQRGKYMVDERPFEVEEWVDEVDGTLEEYLDQFLNTLLGPLPPSAIESPRLKAVVSCRYDDDMNEIHDSSSSEGPDSDNSPCPAPRPTST
ncbi:hypothetical protein VPNG_07049 [Cytospora leucostoma]|uniref:Uncharacterized protein n=1 Tax=Cytospora leucostoma TaxID=1230097 RepID=A0A423WNK6_9PEZI|nr:hypothetical protein VPNG_07049 [Cytospora leucostoma]